MGVAVRWLDLFSGIGGFALGLERAGHETVAFCEIDPFCRKVLAKHWPTVPCYDDIRTLTAGRLAADGIIHAANSGGLRCDAGRPEQSLPWPRQHGQAPRIDGICGGFPCQDISTAGKGAGIEGARSGLWSEYARLIGELRPRYVFVENVAALLGRGLGRVLGDLAALGYDAEWHCIPASAVGAPHRRDRVWIVAYAVRHGFHAGRAISDGNPQRPADNDFAEWQGGNIAPPHLGINLGRPRSEWLSEPDVGRVAHGIPMRVDRLRSLGNAVIPQVVEMIGRAINEINGLTAVAAAASPNNSLDMQGPVHASEHRSVEWKNPSGPTPLKFPA